jgi:hypothetical protein
VETADEFAVYVEDERAPGAQSEEPGPEVVS